MALGIRANRDFITNKGEKLIGCFASGDDIDPNKISPVLERVSAGTREGDLFRLASLTWSVPVSNGFGRRLRYLVWDEYNDKLMGLIAIGDPVFNLSARDKLIGWNSHDRSARLVNIMDAYVLGSLPPYNQLLGGKLIACLLRGIGVPQSSAEAFKWFRLASEQGVANAQYNLGLMYAIGYGAPQDSVEAFKWFHLAAEQGVASVQINLGVMYSNGDSVLQDNVIAHMWYNLASANGLPDGGKSRDKIAAQMTPADISEVQRRARTCLASNYQDCD